MNEIINYVNMLCNNSPNLNYLNACNLTEEGLVLLLLSHELVITYTKRMEFILYILQTTNIIFSSWWHESPLMVISTCSLHKDILTEDQIYELFKLFVNIAPINLTIDYTMFIEDHNNPLFIGLPLDIIVLNPDISIKCKKKIIKLFCNNKYSLYCWESYSHQMDDYNYENIQKNITGPSLLTKILGYYDVSGDKLTYDKKTRHELADFLIHKCNFDIGFSINGNKISRSIIRELLIFANNKLLFDAVLYLINTNIDAKIFSSAIPYNDMIKLELQKCVIDGNNNNGQINIIQNVYILLYEYMCNKLICFGSHFHGIYDDVILPRQQRMDGIIKYTGTVPIYTTKYFREMLTLMCIKKYCSINNGIKQMIRYKIIGELLT